MATIAIKLVLYILCSIVKKAYPNAVSLDALVEDHFNDCLTNTVGTAGFAVSASVNLLWFADPVLAIALALYIIYRCACVFIFFYKREYSVTEYIFYS